MGTLVENELIKNSLRNFSFFSNTNFLCTALKGNMILNMINMTLYSQKQEKYEYHENFIHSSNRYENNEDYQLTYH